MKPYYEHAGITIFLGDCREILPNVKAEAFCTDPPWGLSGSSGTVGRSRAKAIYSSAFVDDERFVRDVASPVVDYMRLAGMRGCCTPGQRHAWEYPKPDDIGCITHPVANGLGPWGHAGWQPVLFYGRDPMLGKTISRMVYQAPSGCTHDSQINHPCPKPLPVMRWLVRRVAICGETILDPFMGSGTTLVAAKLEGRKAIGIEIEERYCEIAAKRLAQEVFNFD